MARSSRRDRGRAPVAVVFFPVHQVIDYLAGLYLVQVGSRLQDRAALVCYIAGAVVIAAAAMSGRPLGGGPVSRPVHRLIDIGIIVGVAAAPFVFGLTDNTSTVLRLEGLAVALVAVVKYTNYVPPQPGAVRDTARALKDQAPRLAGQFVGRRRAAKRRPPDAS